MRRGFASVLKLGGAFLRLPFFLKSNSAHRILLIQRSKSANSKTVSPICIRKNNKPENKLELQNGTWASRVEFVLMPESYKPKAN